MKLLSELKLGNLTLKNRIIMAPLTRMRAGQPGNIPQELNATYYAQRATAGLILSEATQISQQGQGYPATPGIHSKEQIAGWQNVTKAVHNKGGKIFLQLWHVGRISHTSYQVDGKLPVAPSAIPAKNSGTYTADWQPTEILTPRALEISEVKDIVNDFKQAALNAKEANFDGVEIHMANGYLLDQFLQDGSNQRTDEYGGSVANRMKFPLEALDAVIGVWGKDQVGVRLSPYGTFNGVSDSDPMNLFGQVIEEFNKRGIVYINMIEPRATTAGGDDNVNDKAVCTSDLFRVKFNGMFISSGGYKPETAEVALNDNKADAIMFGRWFIANPDLPERIAKKAELNKYDRATFYGGDDKGYTDYPFLS
ncbi:alkene reductase [Candidatus Pelagibacter ubique]|nr:alkene reductase [Candidatus Pelagibacter ubique]